MIPIEPIAPEPMNFGWADFPCVEDKDSSFTLSRGKEDSSYVPVMSLFGSDAPSLAESSDSASDSEEEAVAVTHDALHQQQEQRRSTRVSFGSVEIREYEVVLGNHPWAASYPLSLGWAYREASVQDMDEFEKQREPNLTRRFRTPRRLSQEERRCVLIEHLEDDNVDELEYERIAQEKFETHVPEEGFGELLRVSTMTGLCTRDILSADV